MIPVILETFNYLSLFAFGGDNLQELLQFYHVDLPDEMLVEVFKSFPIREIINNLCLVCKRWKDIIDCMNCLWSDLLLDEWGIEHLSAKQLKTIMSHSSGFTLFSIRYIILKINSPSETSHILTERLVYAKKLVYLDLSGQPVSSLDFLLANPPRELEVLLIDNCKTMNIESVINVVKQLLKLDYLSINGVGMSYRQALTLASLPPYLTYLALSHVKLTPQNIVPILENARALMFLQVSCNVNDEQALLRSAAQNDVILTLRIL